MKRIRTLAMCSAFAVLACGAEQQSTAPPASAPTPAVSPSATAGAPSGTESAEAKQIFETRCYTCHGMTGMGDGPGSAALTPKPRNFHDPAWQASVDDEHLRKIVLYGGAAVGRSPMMPGNPDLTSKPEVVAALRAYVRGLAK